MNREDKRRVVAPCLEFGRGRLAGWRALRKYVPACACSTPTVAILLDTFVLRRDQADAFCGDPTPERATGTTCDAAGERLRTDVYAQRTPESHAHIAADLVQL